MANKFFYILGAIAITPLVLPTSIPIPLIILFSFLPSSLGVIAISFLFPEVKDRD